jgi:lysozyme
VGAATWAALERRTTPIPTPTPTPSPTNPSTPIELINVAKSYRGGAHQDAALKWLQSQIPKATLDEFAKRWRKQV